MLKVLLYLVLIPTQRRRSVSIGEVLYVYRNITHNEIPLMNAQNAATKSGWLMMQRVFFLPEKYAIRYNRHAAPAIIGNMKRAPRNSVISNTIVAALQKVNAIPSHFSPVVFAGGVSPDFVSQNVGIKVLLLLDLIHSPNA